MHPFDKNHQHPKHPVDYQRKAVYHLPQQLTNSLQYLLKIIYLNEYMHGHFGSLSHLTATLRRNSKATNLTFDPMNMQNF